ELVVLGVGVPATGWFLLKADDGAADFCGQRIMAGCDLLDDADAGAGLKLLGQFTRFAHSLLMILVMRAALYWRNVRRSCPFSPSTATAKARRARRDRERRLHRA